MKPKVTIGICVKNCEATIKEAIESIIKQDFPRELMELIIVDGFSTDNTLNIIKSCLKETGIKAKFFREKGGLGRQRQIVVDNAEGEYILWVDGDMLLSADYLRKLVEFMERHPNVGIAKGMESLNVNKKNIVAKLEIFSRFAEKMVNYKSTKTLSKTLGTGGSIYRTEIIRQVGGFDKSLKYYCEDWDIELKIRVAGWSLAKIDTEYLDYERFGLTWRELWKKYWLRGYYTHFFLHKHPRLIKHYRMMPPAAFIAGLICARRIYKVSQKKLAFLLPIHYVFKVTAWYAGFIHSHLSSYEPSDKDSST